MYYVAKTKALISFAVTAKLICVFVFAYAKSRFSHDAAQIRELDERQSRITKQTVLPFSVNIRISQALKVMLTENECTKCIMPKYKSVNDLVEEESKWSSSASFFFLFSILIINVKHTCKSHTDACGAS